MSKIKLNERQLLMLKSLEERPKNKVVKITESQYKRLFNKGTVEPKKVVIEDETKKVDLVEFAEQVIVFIKDILTNPKNVPFSSYWKQFDISKKLLYKLVKDNELLVFSDELNEYSAPKMGFRRKIKELCKKINEKQQSLNEFGGNTPSIGSDFHPNNPANAEGGDFGYQDEPEDIISLEPSEKTFKILHMSDEDGVTIFKRGSKLFVIKLSDVEIGKINKLDNEEGGAVSRFDYNETVDNISPSGMDNWVNHMYNQGEMKLMINDKNDFYPTLTLVTPIVKSKLLSFYGNDEKLSDILNQLPESTTASSSGSFEGPFMSKSPIRTPQKELSNIGNEEELVEMDSADAGGDSGTFAFDAPAGDGSKFWNAGNKLNKNSGTPMVRGKMHEGIKKGQVYKNGSGRIRVDSVENIQNNIITVTKWGDSPKKSFNIEPKQLGGWELFMESKKRILKLTETQLRMILEKTNQDSTAYPNGEMVDFDDCTKLNNNKVAQNGGCSQGAIDDVVKGKKTKHSVVAK